MDPEPDPAPTQVTGTFHAMSGVGIEVRIVDYADGVQVTAGWVKDNQRIKWVFHGKFDADGNLSYKDCVKTVETMGENGEYGAPEQAYTNGSGSMKYDRGSGYLTWKDGKEGLTNNYTFY